MKTLVLGVMLTVPFESGALAAMPPPPPTQQDSSRLTAKANQLLLRVKKVSDDLHLAWFGPTTFIPTYRTIDRDFGDQVNVVGDKVRLGSKTGDFSFRKSDGRLIDYGNVAVSDAMTGPRGPLFHSSEKASWTSEEAMKKASAFLHVFADPLAVRLGPPSAEYIEQGANYEGYWRVYWPRLDGAGHPFYGDFLSIEIPEGSCPLGAGVFLSTPFQEGHGTMLTANEATAKAQAAISAHAFLASNEYFTPDDRIVANKLTSAALEVVLPAKDIKVMGGPSTGAARLAWILWFHPRHLRKQVGNGYNDSFALWVDAYNGEIVGRDGYL